MLIKVLARIGLILMILSSILLIIILIFNLPELLTICTIGWIIGVILGISRIDEVFIK